MSDTQSFIKQKAQEHVAETNEKIMWSLHAVKKLRTEGLRKHQVEACLVTCGIIDDYPMENRPLPGCLVLGYAGTQPIHVVVAVDSDFDRIFIITTYRPSADRWESDWKTRK